LSFTQVRVEYSTGRTIDFQVPEGLKPGDKINLNVPTQPPQQTMKIKVPEGAKTGDKVLLLTRNVCAHARCCPTCHPLILTAAV
jgi:hypothetical protein